MKGKANPRLSAFLMFHEETRRSKTGKAIAPARQVRLFDDDGRRINYLAKRNFVVKAQDLPKQFGFEVHVPKLHFEPDEALMAKQLITGNTTLTKLYFVFNINDHLLFENCGPRRKEFLPTAAPGNWNEQ